ncbi:MAG: glutamate 5-kinase [Acidobacteria bacterium]|nr:glutamate 5-kinase [Acidobacteriota bacterium]
MKPMRIVTKLGTSTLTNGTPHIAPPLFIELARQISQLLAGGHEVLLVSSGAIAMGRERLGFRQLPKDIPAKQMLAAVGQPRLMAMYEQIFGHYRLTAAQVLLTGSDLSSRVRYLNARNTLMALVREKIVPVVNENDTVATEEIRLGDNDHLSALVSNLVDADLLIILTDQPGLHTSNPRKNPGADLVREVATREIPGDLWAAAGESETGLGTGGMVTKLEAADLARRSGTACIIASGNERDVLLRVVGGEKPGTYFKPVVSSMESRKRYILSARKAPGLLMVDEGAFRALKRGGSLLAVGLVTVEADFERGDTVRIAKADGTEIARGIVNYSRRDLSRIAGRSSEEIESLLGYHFGDAVVHRNDMVLL